MKRIINWIKHEYRIFKGVDKPTHKDYKIIYFISWKVFPFIGIGIMHFLSVLYIHLLIYLNLIYTITDTKFILGYCFIIFIVGLLACYMSYLEYLNSNYEE